MNANNQTITEEPVITLNDNAAAIVKSLLYYDVFKHPLKKEEIFLYSCMPHPRGWEIDLALLCTSGFINSQDGYYFVGDDSSVIDKRREGNALAEKYLKKVATHTKWLAKLPFIQCICISGSLSKKYMDQNSDVDYFIITDAKRLWIVRLFITFLIKTLSLLGVKKFMCPNYIITNENLTIEDQNIFTATEIVTLIPFVGQATYDKFIVANAWVKTDFPNFSMHGQRSQLPPSESKSNKSGWIDGFLDKLDSRLFDLYRFHYQRKFAHLLSDNKVKNDLLFNRTCYKCHILPHRNKILDKYKANIRHYESVFNIQLVNEPAFN